MESTSGEMESSSASSTSDGRSMESRTGRSKQRFNSDGQRLAAGVVPVSADREKVMLIQSTRRNCWVLPKGGWETDELEEDAAKREAWEEAGIDVRIDHDLGTVRHDRVQKQDSARSVIHFFEAVVLKEHQTWPESDKRGRRWMTYEDAMEELRDRPELQQALKTSTLKRLL